MQSSHSMMKNKKPMVNKKKTKKKDVKKVEYKLTIKEMPKEERPRERLITFGSKALSNSELLAIILRTGNKNESVLNLCKRLLNNYDIKALSQVSLDELKKIYGIGVAKACQLVACFEIGKRSAAPANCSKRTIKNPSDVADLLTPEMRDMKKECFKTLCLDTKNKLVKNDTISIGSLNTNIVHPREVFKTAISASAAAIILVHNHPSGDPSPSKDDLELTKRLIEVGDIMGIEVLDHIIIGDGIYLSLKEEHLI